MKVKKIVNRVQNSSGVALRTTLTRDTVKSRAITADDELFDFMLVE